jgi:nucleoside-diphosphate-sugar epimerase
LARFPFYFIHRGHRVQAFKTNAFPFTAVRLPDVIGPFDNIGTQLDLYQALREASEDQHVHVSIGSSDRTCSFVHSEDVATAIAMLISSPNPLQVRGETFNVCGDKTSPKDFVLETARVLGVEPGTISWVEDEDPDFMSVDIGHLNNAKLRRAIPNWEPTPLPAFLKATTKWYNDDVANMEYTLEHAASSSESESDSDSSSGSDPDSGSDQSCDLASGNHHSAQQPPKRQKNK